MCGCLRHWRKEYETIKEPDCNVYPSSFVCNCMSVIRIEGFLPALDITYSLALGGLRVCLLDHLSLSRPSSSSQMMTAARPKWTVFMFSQQQQKLLLTSSLTTHNWTGWTVSALDSGRVIWKMASFLELLIARH